MERGDKAAKPTTSDPKIGPHAVLPKRIPCLFATYLEESNRLGAAAGHDERVLGVAHRGVDVDDEEHHAAHHEELAELRVLDREDRRANLAQLLHQRLRHALALPSAGLG